MSYRRQEFTTKHMDTRGGRAVKGIIYHPTVCRRFECQQVKKPLITSKSAATKIRPLSFIQSAAMMRLISVVENLSRARNAKTKQKLA